MKIGQMVPDLALSDLDGRLHRLSEYRGRVVVLVFWSAECPWARRADDALAAMQVEWPADQVVVLSIASNANEGIEELQAAAAARQVSPLLLDRDQQAARQFGATITPEVFVVAPDGRLRYHGAFNDATFRQPEPTTNYLWEAVGALLSGENPVPGHYPPYGCTIVFSNPT